MNISSGDYLIGRESWESATVGIDQRYPLSIVLEKLVRSLRETYRENLERVILFGSRARGDAREDSDIDILIILHREFDDYRESKRIGHFISDLCLEYDVVITCFFTTLEIYRTKNNGFFRNIRAEGIVL
jgi:uncharacterized protein